MRGQVLTIVAATSWLIGEAAYAGPIQITEWMYKGTNGEFVEFTNTGTVAVDMTDWSYSDSDNQPGDLSFGDVFGIVQPGESVILTETNAAVFRTAWGLGSQVKIFGGNTNSNLGRNDEINLYDADGVLVDKLIFGDQSYPGTVRTENRSCNIPAGDYGCTTVRPIANGWVLASPGDAYGSHVSTGGDIGSPGFAVPEPATLLALAIGGFAASRRSRLVGR